MLSGVESFKFFVCDHLNKEEAVKKTRWSIGRFSFQWNRGWLNFNSLADHVMSLITELRLVIH